MIVALLSSSSLAILYIVSDTGRTGRKFMIKRERATMLSIGSMLTDNWFRRHYRMNRKKFDELVDLLTPYVRVGGYKYIYGYRGRKFKYGRQRTKKLYKFKTRAPNGVIPVALRISMCLRYLAGGSVSDIALSHGISLGHVFELAIYPIIDAIQRCPRLRIKYPGLHAVQKRIAKGFRSKSAVDFDCCAGAIDGIILWTEKPTEAECESYGGLQSGSFFCWRKHKFGFNMQAICDADGRFLEYWITSPASASDFITFLTSPFYLEVSEPGFLAPGVALFGDNAYVSNAYMATPYQAVRRNLSDDYNYFHSQLRIRIEMSFGMLTSRWGIMRSPLPASLGLKRQVQIFSACVILHNFCMGPPSYDDSDSLDASEDAVVLNAVPDLLAEDEVNILIAGGISVGEHGEPLSLLHGGEHFDDFGINPNTVNVHSDIARQRMRDKVRDSGKHRPFGNSSLL
jgi:hypothetical protein